MAQIPARIGCQGHGLIRQAYATDFIAILINGWHQTRVWRANDWWHLCGNTFLRPKVEAAEAP
jgi:hypothetical protein